MADSNTESLPGALPRVSLMMFLQFFVWGAWFSTINLALTAAELGDFIGGVYGTVPLGAIFAPLFLGIIADRFLPTQIVMGVLFLLGGVLLWLSAAAGEAGNGERMVHFALGHMLCYMPTLGLANTITFSHLRRLQFPKARVWGTIGWIAAGLFVGAMGWSSSIAIFKVGAVASVLLGLYSFSLPHTPPPAKGQPIDFRAIFMIDAFKLLARPGFLVFAVCSLLICIPLAFYFGQTGTFLGNTGFLQPAATMTIGQMSEIFFMLLIPFFFRRLGVKWMILIGMLAWVVRYLLFSLGAPDQVAWMLYLGVALHGICYDFFFVTGFMYTDAVAPKEIRGQAQSLLIFLTQGLGMFIGYKIVFGIWGIPKKVPSLDQVSDLAGAIGEATEKSDPGYFQQLAQMFSKKLPDGIDETLISGAMSQWKAYWMYPVVMAAVVLVLFFALFWDNTKVSGEEPSAED